MIKKPAEMINAENRKELTLYEISNKFAEIIDKIEYGEITEEEYNELGTQLAIELKNKSSNILAYLQNESSFIGAIDVQIKRLQDMKKVRENKVEKFKQYVKENMEKMNILKLETEIGTISICKNPLSIEIIDNNKVPNKYKKIIQIEQIDKTAIKDDFKETGEIVEGIKFNTNNTYLKIK